MNLWKNVWTPPITQEMGGGGEVEIVDSTFINQFFTLKQVPNFIYDTTDLILLDF